MTNPPFFVLQKKDPAACTFGRLKCIPSEKSNAYNKLSVTHEINQVSWLMRNTCNKPSVKRNTCCKPSFTLAINQVSRIMRNTRKKPNVNRIMYYSCNNTNVMRNACNIRTVIHAVNQVSRWFHAIKHISFFFPHVSQPDSVLWTHQNLHTLPSIFLLSQKGIFILLSSGTTLSLSSGSSSPSFFVLTLYKYRSIWIVHLYCDFFNRRILLWLYQHLDSHRQWVHHHHPLL